MNGSSVRRAPQPDAPAQFLRFASVPGPAVWIVMMIAPLACCLGSAGEAQSPAVPLPTVTVVRPERADLVRKISLAGSARAWEQVMVHSKVAGYIKAIHVDRGDAVQAGEVIAEIEVPELVDDVRQHQAAVDEARSAAEMARSNEARLLSVASARPDAVTAEEIEHASSGKTEAESRLESARAALARSSSMQDYTGIRAPLTAVVGERFLDVGALVQAATSSQASPIVSLYAIDRIRVVVDLPEPDARQISIGNSATLTFDALPGRSFDGRVGRFSGALDPATRTLRSEIDVSNVGHEILPGMFGQVRLNLETHRGAITIPASALVIDKQKRSVFVVENSKVKKVAVRTGADDGIAVEILEGLKGDENLALAGKESLTDGASVRVVGRAP